MTSFGLRAGCVAPDTARGCNPIFKTQQTRTGEIERLDLLVELPEDCGKYIADVGYLDFGVGNTPAGAVSAGWVRSGRDTSVPGMNVRK